MPRSMANLLEDSVDGNECEETATAYEPAVASAVKAVKIQAASVNLTGSLMLLH